MKFRVLELPADSGVCLVTPRKVFFCYFVLPMAFTSALFFICEIFLQIPSVIRFIDIYRPAFQGISLNVHIEKQMWHLEALAQTPLPRIAFVGSSSVVNGVDENIICHNLGDKCSAVHNLGVTGMLAYELLMLKNLILTKDTNTVVYLYNTFSFSNSIRASSGDVRWNTIEAIRLTNDLSIKNALVYFDRMPSELLRLVRYRKLLGTMAFRAITGNLRPLSYPWDYPPDDSPPTDFGRATFADLDRSNWLYQAYSDSRSKADTLGYRGLARFCHLTHSLGIKFIVAPVVEPDFGAITGRHPAEDKQVVDARVKAIIDGCGAVYVPRAIFQPIEQESGFFRDSVHLGNNGRSTYSTELGKLIASGNI